MLPGSAGTAARLGLPRALAQICLTTLGGSPELPSDPDGPSFCSTIRDSNDGFACAVEGQALVGSGRLSRLGWSDQLTWAHPQSFCKSAQNSDARVFNGYFGTTPCRSKNIAQKGSGRASCRAGKL